MATVFFFELTNVNPIFVDLIDAQCFFRLFVNIEWDKGIKF